MRAPLLSATLLLLGGYASPSFAELTDSQRAAESAFSDCVIGAARRLDDHQSDAVSIATAVRSVCASKFHTLEETVIHGMTAEAREVLSRKMDADEIGLSVSAVLFVRRSERPAN